MMRKFESNSDEEYSSRKKARVSEPRFPITNLPVQIRKQILQYLNLEDLVKTSQFKHLDLMDEIQWKHKVIKVPWYWTSNSWWNDLATNG